jgi:hypothetical protein
MANLKWDRNAQAKLTSSTDQLARRFDRSWHFAHYVLSAQRSAICRTSQRPPLRRASGIGAELPVFQAPRSGKCCPSPDLRANGFRRHRGVVRPQSRQWPVGTASPASHPVAMPARRAWQSAGWQVAEAKQGFKWAFATSNQPCARRPNGLRRLRRTSRCTRAVT